MKKLSRLFIIFLTITTFIACEDETENIESDSTNQTEIIEPFIVARQYSQTSGNLGSVEYLPETAYWTNTGLIFKDFSPDTFVQEIKIKNFSFNNEIFSEFDENSTIIGEFIINENGVSHLYTTDIELTSWDDDLYDQGGYIHITNLDSSNNTVNGEIQFSAWRWHNELNREVSFGFNIQFENLINQ